MADPQKYVNDIFDLLQPRGLSKKPTIEKDLTLHDIAKRTVVDSNVNFLGKDGIRQKIVEFCDGAPETAKESIQSFFDEFHAICNSTTAEEQTIKVKVADADDSDYWKRGGSAVDDFNSIFTRCASFASPITVIATRDAFITRADCNTEDVEMFLNYTPNHIANTLLPYLEVEMRMNKIVKGSNDKALEEGLYYLNTPSTLRFLLGSIPASQTSASDRALLRIVNPENPKLTNNFTKELLKVPSDSTVTQGGQASPGNGTVDEFKVRAEARSGMDLFFAPQSLTNMDSLKSSDHSSRLIDAKPFVPFASIMGFELTIANAGAGDMVTKHGKLELEIHDKSRISEMSEFLTGPAGYGSAQIWTSFGWLCPRDAWNELDDDYAKFINEKMHTEVCWQVKNTQFGFDVAGRVKLTLELVSFGSSDMKKGDIKIGLDDYERLLYHFERTIEALQQSSKQILSSPLGPEARIVQLINAGASGRMLPSGETNIDELITKVVTAYGSTRFDPAEQTTLINNLRTILDPSGAGRTSLDSARVKSITSFLVGGNGALAGPDPFLYAENLGNGFESAKLQRYFDDRLIQELNFLNDPTRKHPDIAAKEKDGKAKTAAAPQTADSGKKEVVRQEINVDKYKIVSFGKLFCNTVLPALIESLKIDDPTTEVQVIFYTLNDECGPVSGQSIAEFPIDLTRFVYALDDAMKARMKATVTTGEFFTAIVNNQFNDDRSIGYGMLSKWLHAPFDRNKPKIENAEQNSEYESRLAAWQSENPSFARPMIEMAIERTPTASGSPNRIHKMFDRGSSASNIVKIHVYDKQHNPRKLFSQVASVGPNLKLGAWDISAVRNRVRQLARQGKSAVGDKKAAAAAKKTSLAAVQTQINNYLQSLNDATTNPQAAEKFVSFKDIPGEDKGFFVQPTLFGKNGIRAALSLAAPTITLGLDGTLVKSANLASKTDDLIAAANLVNLMKAQKGTNQNSPTIPLSGLEGPGGLPIRTVPANLSMTTFGCPSARCYQQYFVDLGTGTSLDNLYTCTQITHKIGPGKFESSFTFAFTDGYGKFGAPPSAQILLKQEKRALENSLQSVKDELVKLEPKRAPAAATPATPPTFGAGTVPTPEITTLKTTLG